jgi:hypothetical protein
MNDDELQESVEKLIDRTSLSKVLDAVAVTCFAKSQHLAENWQDHESARAWDRAGDVVTTAATRKSVERVSF